MGEDGEAEPYNKRDKDEVPSKALTGDSRPSDMEDAWGDDPRWQVRPALLKPMLLYCRHLHVVLAQAKLPDS